MPHIILTGKSTIDLPPRPGFATEELTFTWDPVARPPRLRIRKTNNRAYIEWEVDVELVVTT